MNTKLDTYQKTFILYYRMKAFAIKRKRILDPILETEIQRIWAEDWKLARYADASAVNLLY
jgi:hypothetical protein